MAAHAAPPIGADVLATLSPQAGFPTQRETSLRPGGQRSTSARRNVGDRSLIQPTAERRINATKSVEDHGTPTFSRRARSPLPIRATGSNSRGCGNKFCARFGMTKPRGRIYGRIEQPVEGREVADR
jgi:hypothetical protein